MGKIGDRRDDEGERDDHDRIKRRLELGAVDHGNDDQPAGNADQAADHDLQDDAAGEVEGRAAGGRRNHGHPEERDGQEDRHRIVAARLRSPASSGRGRGA